MAVNIFNNSISGCYIGNGVVSAIYQGDEKLYPTQHLYKVTYTDGSEYEEPCNSSATLYLQNIPNFQDVVDLSVGCATRFYQETTSTYDGTFSGFTSLENVTFENDELEYFYTTGTSFIYESLSTFAAFGNITTLKSFKFPKNIGKINPSFDNIRTFYNAQSLETIDFSSQYFDIGQAFAYGCKKLTSIITPYGENVVSYSKFSADYVSNYIFEGCSSLPFIEIKATNGFVGSKAFNGCTSLQYIKFYDTTPPTLINTNAFYSTNNCPIYVPSESLEAYKTATNWSTYADRIQPIT